MTHRNGKAKRLFTRRRCLEIALGTLAGLLLFPVTDHVVSNGTGLKSIRAVFSRAQLRRELSRRELIIPSPAEHGFSPDALVLLVDLGFSTNGVHAPMGSGFAVGDGSLVLTAAHCVTPKDSENRRLHTSTIFAVSPYYGDVFPVEIVAIYEKADIALLRPHWSGHPALQLGTVQDLVEAQDLYALTRSASERDFLQKSKDASVFSSPYAGQARMERLPVKTVNGLRRSQAIVMESTRFITGGWSGSALLRTDNAHVVGILASLNIKGKSSKTSMRRAQGASLRSINTLLDEHDLRGPAGKRPVSLPAISDAHEAYAQIHTCITRLRDRDLSQSFAAARKLTELRKDSVMAHFLVGLCSHLQYAKDRTDQSYLGLAEHSFEKALSISDDKALMHAVNANFLRLHKQRERALTHVDEALALDPEQELALYNRLILLMHAAPEKAEKAAKALVELHPQKARYWYDYGSILYIRTQHHEQALHAAQEAVRLDPEGKYGRLLAQTLEKLGRLDEAEANYLAMTGDCACQRCWFVYAHFLLRHRSEDATALAQANEAFKQAEQEDKRGRMKETDMRKLKVKLNLALVKQDKEQSLDLAEERVQRYLQADPNEAHYWWALADVKRSQEAYPGAVLAARRAVALAPDRDFRARLANVLAKAGELTESEQVYQEMLTRHPERARYRYWFAEYLVEHCPDRMSEAQTLLLKASDPNAPWPVDPNDLAALGNKMAAVTD